MELQRGYNFPFETLFHLNRNLSSYSMYVSTRQARKIKSQDGRILKDSTIMPWPTHVPEQVKATSYRHLYGLTLRIFYIPRALEIVEAERIQWAHAISEDLVSDCFPARWNTGKKRFSEKPDSCRVLSRISIEHFPRVVSSRKFAKVMHLDQLNRWWLFQLPRKIHIVFLFHSTMGGSSQPHLDL